MRTSTIYGILLLLCMYYITHIIQLLTAPSSVLVLLLITVLFIILTFWFISGVVSEEPDVIASGSYLTLAMALQSVIFLLALQDLLLFFLGFIPAAMLFLFSVLWKETEVPPDLPPLPKQETKGKARKKR